MTKRELIDALSGFTDDVEITVNKFHIASVELRQTKSECRCGEHHLHGYICILLDIVSKDDDGCRVELWRQR